MMKCIVCRGQAHIKIRSQNAGYCNEHFGEHIHRQVARVIKEYHMLSPNDTILVAVSGGKDSMGLWNILTTQGYRVRAFHLNNGFGEFSEKSEEAVKAYGEKLGTKPVIYRFEDVMGFDFDTACRYAHKRACSICGTIKRHIMNRAALDLECDVLATGHNLDDEASVLLGNVLHWQTGYLSKQSPVLAAGDGLACKIKPLVRVLDMEMDHYVRIHDIPVVKGSCPFEGKATRNHNKEHMHMIEEHSPGTKAFFYTQFLKRVREHIPAPPPRDESSRGICEACGYPTLAKRRCSVCELKEKVTRGQNA